MSPSVTLVITCLFLTLSACSNAKDGAANTGVPSTLAEKPGGSTNNEASTKESSDATTLYRGLMTLNSQDHKLNEDLVSAYFYTGDRREALLENLEKRSKAIGDLFKKSLKFYFEACSNYTLVSDKKVCSSKGVSLDMTNTYFAATPATLRPREFCDNITEPVTNLACETANDLLWTAYKIERARQLK
jgi:hypothetical protein